MFDFELKSLAWSHKIFSAKHIANTFCLKFDAVSYAGLN